MTPSRTFALLATLGILLLARPSAAQDTYKAEPLKEAPPSDLSEAIRATLSDEGYRITRDGKPFFDVWFRKEIAASAKPSGAKGAVQFPFLGEGELLGAVRYAEEGYDYRDQSILTGSYTIRYGLQPVNGDHLGVSTYRDYALIVPADLDQKPEPLEEKPLERQSAEAAGTSHPAVLMLLTAPEGVDSTPAMHHGDENDTWGLVAPVKLKVEGESDSTTLPIQLIVSGAAAV